jgi:hypothetical protein
MPTRGLILRVIPYSDNLRIIRCLTDKAGLQSFGVRASKNKRSSGLVQTGTFIEFEIPSRPSKLPTLSDYRIDPTMNQLVHLPHQSALWFFVLEITSKSAAEGLHIPGLRETIDRYYNLLCAQQAADDPIVPLLAISNTLGIMDPISLNLQPEIGRTVQKLGVAVSEFRPDLEETQFTVLLKQFQTHFSITRLDSIDILF